jgi:membrane-associated protease RseP (regulator of RpoE activity)
MNMRNWILAITSIGIVLAATAWAVGSSSLQPSEGVVYSSEELFDGSSYLGVDTRDVTADRLGPLQLKEESGVEVTMVDEDAPAGKAGLKEHDVILSINGAPVESVEQLRRMIREIPAGRVISIGVSRNGQALTLKAQLANRKGFGPEAGEFKFTMPTVAMPPIPPMPPMPDIDMPVSIVVVHSSMRTGLMVENLTSQLADFFGAKGGKGILVRSVEKGSSAEKAGFHAGDVIVRVNDETVNDAGDFSHALRNGKDNTAKVGILRDKREQTITLQLPERKQSDFFEESLGLPQVKAETERQLSVMDLQLALIKPQVELAAREIERVKPELEREARACSLQQKKLTDELSKMKVRVHGQQDQLRLELREGLRMLKGHQADI